MNDILGSFAGRYGESGAVGGIRNLLEGTITFTVDDAAPDMLRVFTRFGGGGLVVLRIGALLNPSDGEGRHDNAECIRVFLAWERNLERANIGSGGIRERGDMGIDELPIGACKIICLCKNRIGSGTRTMDANQTYITKASERQINFTCAHHLEY